MHKLSTPEDFLHIIPYIYNNDHAGMTISYMHGQCQHTHIHFTETHKHVDRHYVSLYIGPNTETDKHRHRHTQTQTDTILVQILISAVFSDDVQKLRVSCKIMVYYNKKNTFCWYITG